MKAEYGFIINGTCLNKGDYICNLGYACDGCPYNIELWTKDELIDWIYSIRKELLEIAERGDE